MRPVGEERRRHPDRLSGFVDRLVLAKLDDHGILVEFFLRAIGDRVCFRIAPDDPQMLSLFGGLGPLYDGKGLVVLV